MLKEATAAGATIEEAQQAAVAALNAPEDADVQFEVLTFPEKKKFGLFGGKEAEVRAFYEEEEAKTAGKKTARKKAAPAAKPEKPNKPAEKKAPKPAKSEAKSDKAAAKPEKAAAPAEAPAEPEPVREPVALEDCPETVKTAYAYLVNIIKGIGIEGTTVNVQKTDREYFFEILSEEDYSLLIGRRGETLNAIQYLVRLAANHGREEGKAVRISLNVGDYRQKREKTLREIARKNAKRVRKYGRSITLNPMNPSERRIIHTTVTEVEGVQSYSVGADADRRVVIALAEGAKPLNERRGGGGRGRNDRSRGGRNDRRGGGRDRRPRNDAPAAPSRAPRKDVEGVLYGKIEIPKTRTEPAAEAADPAPAVDYGEVDLNLETPDLGAPKLDK